jgi:hypothetical protein
MTEVNFFAELLRRYREADTASEEETYKGVILLIYGPIISRGKE